MSYKQIAFKLNEHDCKERERIWDSEPEPNGVPI